MNVVAVGGRACVATVKQLMGVPNHLTEVRREDAELGGLRLGREVHRPVHESAHQREIGLLAAPEPLRDQRGQPLLVLLL